MSRLDSLFLAAVGDILVARVVAGVGPLVHYGCLDLFSRLNLEEVRRRHGATVDVGGECLEVGKFRATVVSPDSTVECVYSAASGFLIVRTCLWGHGCVGPEPALGPGRRRITPLGEGLGKLLSHGLGYLELTSRAEEDAGVYGWLVTGSRASRASRWEDGP